MTWWRVNISDFWPHQLNSPTFAAKILRILAAWMGGMIGTGSRVEGREELSTEEETAGTLEIAEASTRLERAWCKENGIATMFNWEETDVLFSFR